MLSKLYEININKNVHYIKRYISFILKMQTRILANDIKTHKHHILPKAKDMFPEYANLTENKWNSIMLTHREHFIAHMILNKAFSGSSQTLAFYNMTRCFSLKSGKMYEKLKGDFTDMMGIINKNPNRCANISKALKGKPKSDSHIKKLMGHEVTQETREKLRQHNLGKKHSEESKLKMSISRTGKKRGPNKIEANKKCSETKRSQNLKWYNNGIEAKQMVDPIDETWVLGRLKSPTEGKKCYNNGTINKMFIGEPPLDEIWVAGRIKL